MPDSEDDEDYGWADEDEAAMPAPPRLARFLEPEIKQGLVTVTDEADRSTVRLRGDSFFASGSAEPMARALPVLARIAQALSEVQGAVLIWPVEDEADQPRVAAEIIDSLAETPAAEGAPPAGTAAGTAPAADAGAAPAPAASSN